MWRSGLWIDDPDSEEAVIIAALAKGQQRYCCLGSGVAPAYQRRGCFCGENPCVCGDVSCPCQQNLDVCQPTVSGVYPGQLVVEMSSINGLLSWYPLPGRPVLSTITFFELKSGVGASLEDCLQSSNIPTAGFGYCATQCADQATCSRNVSRLILKGSKTALQQGISDGYLSYLGSENYFGLDTIRIWVSDQGFTDECYSDVVAWRHGAVQELPVRVIGVNDAPVVSAAPLLLDYSSSATCKFDILNPPEDGGNCLNISRVPPSSKPLTVYDVDIDSGGTPNATMILSLGRVGAGRFQLTTIAQDTSYLQAVVGSSGMISLTVSGTGGLSGINTALATLFFSAGTGFLGYCPFTLTVQDNGNWGECSGEHTCGQAEPCFNYRTAAPHVPDVVRSTTQVLAQILIH